MTLLKYVLGSGVCTTAELLRYKREDPKGYVAFMDMAKDEMTHRGIPIERKEA